CKVAAHVVRKSKPLPCIIDLGDQFQGGTVDLFSLLKSLYFQTFRAGRCVPRFLLQPYFISAENLDGLSGNHALLAEAPLHTVKGGRTAQGPQDRDCQAPEKPAVRIVRKAGGNQGRQRQRKDQECRGQKQNSDRRQGDGSFNGRCLLLQLALEQFDAGLRELLQLHFHVAEDRRHTSAILCIAVHR